MRAGLKGRQRAMLVRAFGRRRAEEAMADLAEYDGTVTFRAARHEAALLDQADALAETRERFELPRKVRRRLTPPQMLAEKPKRHKGDGEPHTRQPWEGADDDSE